MCDTEIVSRKVGDAKDKVKNLGHGFRRDIFHAYASIRHNTDPMLLAVGSRLRELIDREAQELQRCDNVALQNGAGGAR